MNDLLRLLLLSFALLLARSYINASDIFVSEVRAVWFTTLNGLDWPSRPARTVAEVERQKTELRQQFDALASLGFNVILFQTRLRATVAYASDIEPWDAVFTGTVGRVPLHFDPLSFAIQEAHARGMELHAWIVAFPAMKQSVARQLGRKALPIRYPHLVQRSGDAWMMDPGVPGTATYIATLCAEVTRNYDIDGIHLDYIRYPEPSIPFNDNATYRHYGRDMERGSWRRANVTRVVRTVHDSVRAIKPWVTLSCAPVGKYSDLARYAAGGWNARDAVFQEAQRWQQEGWMDWLFPMLYFQGNNFYPFALNWIEQSGGKPIIPGLGIYFLAPEERNWSLSIIRRQLLFLRTYGASGQAYFRTRYLLQNVKGLADFLKQEYYAIPALVPPKTWLKSIAPYSPTLSMRRERQALHFSWNKPLGAHSFNLYRTDALGQRHLVLRRYEDTTYIYRPALPSSLYDTFTLTAVNRQGVQSHY